MNRVWDLHDEKTRGQRFSVRLEELRKVLDLHGSLDADGYTPLMEWVEDIGDEASRFGDFLYEDQPVYKSIMDSYKFPTTDWKQWAIELSNFWEPLIQRLLYEEYKELVPSRPLKGVPKSKTFADNLMLEVEDILYAAIWEYLHQQAVERGTRPCLDEWLCLESNSSSKRTREANNDN